MTMTEIVLTVRVPQNLMALCCASSLMLNSDNASATNTTGATATTGTANSKPKGPYNLKTVDPARLRAIIKMVQSAADNDLDIFPRRQNGKMKSALNKYNQTVPASAQLTREDVVRMISWNTYTGTEPSLDTKHPEDEVHIFEKINVPGVTTNAKTRVYVKFVDPVEGEPIKVISVHRSCDR